ncbi:hypothetical protein DH2020_005909 [Rehmannia glutinosa]|uniref:Pectin acetylesterase n=1 Tax=Rehmannia glutinosa TaxID=99300 RepID=A0ABR0XHD4_REHGL
MTKNIGHMADHRLIKLLISSLVLVNSQVNAASFVNITLLESAVSKGAVCLDGSPPAYAFDKGFGSGANNWLVFLEGGAWCTSTAECIERSKGDFGSSVNRRRLYFSGILDQNQTFNPGNT